MGSGLSTLIVSSTTPSSSTNDGSKVVTLSAAGSLSTATENDCGSLASATPTTPSPSLSFSHPISQAQLNQQPSLLSQPSNLSSDSLPHSSKSTSVNQAPTTVRASMTLEGHRHRLITVLVTRNKQQIVSVGEDVVKVWNSSSYECEAIIRPVALAIIRAAILVDRESKLCIAGAGTSSQPYNLEVYALEDGGYREVALAVESLTERERENERETLTTHTEEDLTDCSTPSDLSPRYDIEHDNASINRDIIYSLVLLPDGDRVCCGCGDGTVRIVSLSDRGVGGSGGKCERILHTPIVMLQSPYSLSCGGMCYSPSVHSLSPTQSSHSPSLAVSLSCPLLTPAQSHNDNDATGVPLPGAIYHLRVLRDGRVCAGSSTGLISVWGTAFSKRTGNPIGREKDLCFSHYDTVSPPGMSSITALCALRDGRLCSAATGGMDTQMHGGDGMVKVWTLDSQFTPTGVQCVFSLSHVDLLSSHGAVHALLSLTRQGLLAIASEGGDGRAYVTLWSLPSLKEKERKREPRCESVCVGHTDAVTGLALLGRDRLCSVSEDCTARVWSLSGDLDDDDLPPLTNTSTTIV